VRKKIKNGEETKYGNDNNRNYKSSLKKTVGKLR
jgi:hypothetical protein